jgi:hypothetical protein
MSLDSTKPLFPTPLPKREPGTSLTVIIGLLAAVIVKSGLSEFAEISIKNLLRTLVLFIQIIDNQRSLPW